MAAKRLAVTARTNLCSVDFKLSLSVLLVLILLASTPCQAQKDGIQIPKDHSPKVCTNYNFEADSWSGIQTKVSPQPKRCPQNQVLLSVRTSMRRNIASGPKYVHLSGSCCPLPADDILLDETRMENEACPENFIAVGVTLDVYYADCDSSQKSRCTRLIYETPSSLICQKINTKRYQLAAPTSGIANAASAHLRHLFFEDFTRAKHIPLALRYGILRSGRTNLERLTCVGYPWGSIVTGKQGKLCSKIQFRQLQYRGRAGDPKKGSAVALYPECVRLDNPLAKEPRCITVDDVDVSADDL